METDYKLIFQSMPGLHIVLLPDLTIVTATIEYLQATFTQFDEISGKNILTVFPPNQQEKSTNAISDLTLSFNYVIANKKPHFMQIHRYDIRDPKGGLIEKYWSTVNKPILDENNNLRYIIHSAEDVSEYYVLKNLQQSKNNWSQEINNTLINIESRILSHSKRVELLNNELESQLQISINDLKKNNNLLIAYKKAIDEANIVAITNSEGIIEYANDNFSRVSKYAKEELIGQDHILVNSGYHSKEFIANLWNTIQKGKIWKGQIKNRAKDGSTYWVDTTIMPMLNDKGVPEKYLALRSDITEMKDYMEQLQSSEENYRTIFENALVAMTTIDARTKKIVNLNNCCLKLFGYASKNEMLEIFDPLFHVPDQNKRKHYLDKLNLEGEVVEREIEMRKLDGSIFYADLYIKTNIEKTLTHSIIIDVSNQIITRRILKEKITIRTKKLSEALQREKELNIMKSRFVSFASHEFRTPLTVIHSSASLLQMFTKENQQEERIKAIKSILSSVRNLTGILDNFLTLAKLENGKLEVNASIIDITILIKDLSKEMEGFVSKKKQLIKYHHAGKSEVVLPNLIIRNIVINLISNASKYSEYGKVIEINSTVKRNRLMISVKDEGFGILPEEHKNLFSEFFRGKESKHIEGTGLGLSIVKKYVEYLQGKISFKSEINKGTIFTVEIPLNLNSYHQIKKL